MLIMVSGNSNCCRCADASDKDVALSIRPLPLRGVHDPKPDATKAAILAGGLGTRIAEATHLRPKSMVEIGGRSIHWHIPELFAHHAINEFVICGGYKGYVIKEFFSNYPLPCIVAKRSSGGGRRNPLLRRGAVLPHLRR
jgi:hypothetical protein